MQAYRDAFRSSFSSQLCLVHDRLDSCCRKHAGIELLRLWQFALETVSGSLGPAAWAADSSLRAQFPVFSPVCGAVFVWDGTRAVSYNPLTLPTHLPVEDSVAVLSL